VKHSHPHQRCAKARAHKHTFELGAGSWRSISYRCAFVLMECRVSALFSPGGDADIHAPSGGSNFNLCQEDEGASRVHFLVEPEATPKEMMQPKAASFHRASLARGDPNTNARARTHTHTHTHTLTLPLSRAHTQKPEKKGVLDIIALAHARIKRWRAHTCTRTHAHAHFNTLTQPALTHRWMQISGYWSEKRL
jgi:hypothetical protein